MTLLTDLIPSTTMYDVKLTELWVNLKDMLLENYVVDEVDVNIVLATKYKFDMVGLLKEMGIDENAIFPHILINGYSSGREYDGSLLKIKKLDASIVNRFYNSYLTSN